MRLRTNKQNARSGRSSNVNEEEELSSPEPSTSKLAHMSYAAESSAHSSPKGSSPNSPGRVAKRNARLLSGLDLGTGQHAAGYSAEHLVGTIPDFSIRRIQEVCPAISHALETNFEASHGLDDGLLTDVQFQLENLLADNIDWQKNIYGELTFLSSGDYPTDDLRSRPMPSYELRSDSTSAHHHIDMNETQPSISYVDHHYKQEEDEMGSDIVSSMDEGDLDEPYCVLDIPHRFWVWVREYVGHVDEKFLAEFNKNFFERYQPEQLEKFFINEPFKYKPDKNAHSSPTHKHHQLNGVHKNEMPNGRKASRISMNGIHEPDPSLSPPPKKRLSMQASRDQLLKSLRTEDSATDLMKRLVAAYIEENSSAPKKVNRGRKPYGNAVISPPKTSSSISKSKRPKTKNKPKRNKNGVNGDVKLNGYINGMESTDDETSNDLLGNSEMMDSIGKALADCVLPAALNGIDAEDDESETEESETEENENTQDEQPTLSQNMENFELVNLKLDTKHTIEDLDEVSTELLKAQQRLEELIKKVSPALKKCKEGLEAEHAHWLTTRALNSIDDELFHLANQIPAGATHPPDDVFKQCMDVWEQRKRFLLQHYMRDHVKFVQYVEKSSLDVKRAQDVLGPSSTPDVTKNKRRSIKNKDRAKTRSNRKKASVKKELCANGDE